MIKTAQMKMCDPALSMVLRAVGQGRSERIISEGLIEIPHFSPDYTYNIVRMDWSEETKHNCSFDGVADTPEQALEYATKHLGNLPDNFCVFVTHIEKNPSNAGRGGGWRWHKWGEYIGKGAPTCEYLDDEEKFEDGVYVFNISKVP